MNSSVAMKYSKFLVSSRVEYRDKNRGKISEGISIISRNRLPSTIALFRRLESEGNFVDYMIAGLDDDHVDSSASDSYPKDIRAVKFQ